MKLTREEQKELTRENIIDVATKIFIEKGFVETKMIDIYQKANVSKKTMYRYFSSKEELAFTIESIILKKILDKYRLQAFPNSIKTSYDRIEFFLKDFLIKLIAENGGYFRFFAEFDMLFTDEYSDIEASNELTSRLLDSFEEFMILINLDVSDKSLREDLDYNLVLKSIINSVIALAERLVVRADKIKKEQNVGFEMLDVLIDMSLTYVKA